VSWNIEGRYFENCSCNVVCPCTASLALGADYDECLAALVFHIDSGAVEGVDVSGLNVIAVIQSGKYMHEGNWRLGVLMDEAASDEQAEKLGGVFSGELGGPMEAAAPLVAEQLGVARVPMEFSSENGHHRVKIGDTGQLAVDDVVPFGVETGEPARLVDIFHPAATALTVAKAADDSKMSAFELEFGNPGGSGFSTQFAWAA
jgi:hypothetical protein